MVEVHFSAPDIRVGGRYLSSRIRFRTGDRLGKRTEGLHCGSELKSPSQAVQVKMMREKKSTKHVSHRSKPNSVIRYLENLIQSSMNGHSNSWLQKMFPRVDTLFLRLRSCEFFSSSHLQCFRRRFNKMTKKPSRHLADHGEPARDTCEI